MSDEYLKEEYFNKAIESYNNILINKFYPPHLIKATNILLNNLIKNNLINWHLVDRNEPIEEFCITFFHKLLNHLCQNFSYYIIYNGYNDFNDLYMSFNTQLDIDMLNVKKEIKKQFDYDNNLIKKYVYNQYIDKIEKIFQKNQELKNITKNTVFLYILAGQHITNENFFDLDLFH